MPKVSKTQLSVIGVILAGVFGSGLLHAQMGGSGSVTLTGCGVTIDNFTLSCLGANNFNQPGYAYTGWLNPFVSPCDSATQGPPAGLYLVFEDFGKKSEKRLGCYSPPVGGDIGTAFFLPSSWWPPPPSIMVSLALKDGTGAVICSSGATAIATPFPSGKTITGCGVTINNASLALQSISSDGTSTWSKYWLKGFLQPYNICSVASNLSVVVESPLVSSVTCPPCAGDGAPLCWLFSFQHPSSLPTGYDVYVSLKASADCFSSPPVCSGSSVAFPTCGKPVIAAPPSISPSTPACGDTVTLSVDATCAATYQWERRQAQCALPAFPIPGATSSKLVIPGVSACDNNTCYQVRVSNGNPDDTTVSASVTLIVAGCGSGTFFGEGIASSTHGTPAIGVSSGLPSLSSGSDFEITLCNAKPNAKAYLAATPCTSMMATWLECQKSFPAPWPPGQPLNAFPGIGALKLNGVFQTGTTQQILMVIGSVLEPLLKLVFPTTVTSTWLQTWQGFEVNYLGIPVVTDGSGRAVVSISTFQKYAALPVGQPIQFQWFVYDEYGQLIVPVKPLLQFVVGGWSLFFVKALAKQLLLWILDGAAFWIPAEFLPFSFATSNGVSVTFLP